MAELQTKHGLPVIEVQLDKPRKIRLGMNAMVLVEQVISKQRGTHYTWDEIVKGSIGVTETRVILWAGLLYDDPELTLAQVGDIFDECDKSAMNEAVDKVWQSQMTEAEPGDAPGGSEADSPLPQAGSSSGGSPASTSV